MKKKKKNYKKRPSSIMLFRGGFGPAWPLVVLGLVVMIIIGVAFIGDPLPQNKNPIENQPVIIISNTPEPGKNNLQLYMFPGVTYTPTPTPTPIPTSPPQPASSRGGGGGGSSAPHGGGGGVSVGTAL